MNHHICFPNKIFDLSLYSCSPEIEKFTNVDVWTLAPAKEFQRNLRECVDKENAQRKVVESLPEFSERPALANAIDDEI